MLARYNDFGPMRRADNGSTKLFAVHSSFFTMCALCYNCSHELISRHLYMLYRKKTLQCEELVINALKSTYVAVIQCNRMTSIA